MARAASTTGPFHGTMLSTTPTDWRTVIDSAPGLSVGMVSPWICVASEAVSRNRLAARCTLKPAHSAEAPTSAAITSMNSGVRASNASAALSKMRRRSDGADLRQVW